VGHLREGEIPPAWRALPRLSDDAIPIQLLLRSVDFAAVEEFQRTGRWHEAGKLLAAEAQALVAGGAELLVLCTNTVHRVADEIAAAVEVPLVHIADTTAEAMPGDREGGLPRRPDAPVPVLDTTRLHAERAVDLALAT